MPVLPRTKKVTLRVSYFVWTGNNWMLKYIALATASAVGNNRGGRPVSKGTFFQCCGEHTHFYSSRRWKRNDFIVQATLDKVIRQRGKWD